MRILSAYDETVPPGEPIRYGNGQTLVPIEDLAAARARIAELEAQLASTSSIVIALPTPVGPDGDGQVWFDDFDIRVDMTGRRDDTRLYVNGEPRTPSAVHQHALALLAAAIVAGGGS